MRKTKTMKRMKYLLIMIFSMMSITSFAQDLDLETFNNPAFAKYGNTPEERKENYLSTQYLKYAVNSGDYDSAIDYFKQLVNNCPRATETIYVLGITIYKNKIESATSKDEKYYYLDLLMQVYDLRLEYFGDHPTRGEDYLLDRKRREYQYYENLLNNQY